jgi:hypothetical protein
VCDGNKIPRRYCTVGSAKLRCVSTMSGSLAWPPRTNGRTIVPRERIKKTPKFVHDPSRRAASIQQWRHAILFRNSRTNTRHMVARRMGHHQDSNSDECGRIVLCKASSAPSSKPPSMPRQAISRDHSLPQAGQARAKGRAGRLIGESPTSSSPPCCFRKGQASRSPGSRTSPVALAAKDGL